MEEKVIEGKVVEGKVVEVEEEKKGAKKVFSKILHIGKKALPFLAGGIVTGLGVAAAFVKMKGGKEDGYSELPKPADFAPSVSSDDFAEEE